MSKFFLNPAIFSAIFELISTYYTTKENPKHWRVPFLWILAIITLLVAIGSVREQNKITDQK